VPETAFDGGILSAETLGRGQNSASAQGTPASGAENPAAINSSNQSSAYTTVFVGNSSNLSKTQVRNIDPLEDNIVQFLSLTSEQGSIFFEPLGRFNQRQPLFSNGPSGDFRNVDFSANAIGLAGSTSLGKRGSIGLSLSYLYSSLGYGTYQSNTLTDFKSDTGDGVRLGFGARYPTGPFLWGLVLNNFPGFLWWQHHSQEILPVTIQIGETWRIYPGFLFSISGETRYYDEGSDRKDYLKIGQEIPLGKTLILRFGTFGTNLNNPEERHLTGGLTFQGSSGAEISYAFDAFQFENEKIKKSYLSLRLPFGESGPESINRGISYH